MLFMCTMLPIVYRSWWCCGCCRWFYSLEDSGCDCRSGACAFQSLPIQGAAAGRSNRHMDRTVSMTIHSHSHYQHHSTHAWMLHSTLLVSLHTSSKRESNAWLCSQAPQVTHMSSLESTMPVGTSFETKFLKLAKCLTPRYLHQWSKILEFACQ